MRVVTHRMVASVTAMLKKSRSRPMSLARFSRVSPVQFLINHRLLTLWIDQMTIMVETSRTFLFTEYARTICGTIHTQGTDPKVWDVLPDHFSAHPETKKLLARLKEEKAAEKKRVDYYHNLDLLKGRPDLVNGHQ